MHDIGYQQIIACMHACGALKYVSSIIVYILIYTYNYIYLQAHVYLRVIKSTSKTVSFSKFAIFWSHHLKQNSHNLTACITQCREHDEEEYIILYKVTLQP